jgi:hypothetical protein
MQLAEASPPPATQQQSAKPTESAPPKAKRGTAKVGEVCKVDNDCANDTGATGCINAKCGYLKIEAPPPT